MILPQCLLVYRFVIHKSTHFSLFEMLIKKIRLPVNTKYLHVSKTYIIICVQCKKHLKNIVIERQNKLNYINKSLLK